MRVDGPGQLDVRPVQVELVPRAEPGAVVPVGEVQRHELDVRAEGETEKIVAGDVDLLVVPLEPVEDAHAPPLDVPVVVRLVGGVAVARESGDGQRAARVGELERRPVDVGVSAAETGIADPVAVLVHDVRAASVGKNAGLPVDRLGAGGAGDPHGEEDGGGHGEHQFHDSRSLQDGRRDDADGDGACCEARDGPTPGGACQQTVKACAESLDSKGSTAPKATSRPARRQWRSMRRPAMRGVSNVPCERFQAGNGPRAHRARRALRHVAPSHAPTEAMSQSLNVGSRGMDSPVPQGSNGGASRGRVGCRGRSLAARRPARPRRPSRLDGSDAGSQGFAAGRRRPKARRDRTYERAARAGEAASGFPLDGRARASPQRPPPAGGTVVAPPRPRKEPP